MTLASKLMSGRTSRYLALVAAPTMLVWLYLALVAVNGYVSRAQVMVEGEPNVAAAGAELALGLLNAGGGKSKQDALLVRNFMLSRTMLAHLDEKLDLRGHFSAPGFDVVRRLDAEASTEEFLKFYQRQLHVVVDDESLMVAVEFTAFDPEFAQRVVQQLLKHSEAFVNDISRAFAREQLRFVEDEVDQANERLKAATREMIDLQRQNEVFSPEWETEALAKILGELEGELARERTQLKALQSYLNAAAPEVVAARQRVQALEAQVAQERARLVGKQNTGLNDLMLDYQDAEVNVRLASEIYKTALATLEATRLESVRKVKFLAVMDEASLPDAVEHPRILYWTLTFFLLLNIGYFVVNLIIAAVEDHRE